MACKQTDDLGRYFASISMQDGSQMKCRMKEWALSDIKVCINCNLVPSTLYNLQCSHKLCKACFNKHACYYCPMDHTRSQQYETSPVCTFNSGLLKTTLECPLCGAVHKFSKLQEHFKTRHPEVALTMNPSRPESKTTQPNTIRPPPGFPGHVSPVGRGKGLLFNDANAYPREYEECGRQQVLNSKELALFGTRPENMEISAPPQAMDQPADDESPQIEDQPTTGLCVYCAAFVKSDERKEHFENCLALFLQWKEWILNNVFHDSQENELDGDSKSLGHIYTCPVLDLECKRSFILMIHSNAREHCSDVCPGSKPGRSCVQEHVSNCPKFFAKCSELVNRVVGKYRRDHSSDGCPKSKKTTGIFEGEVIQGSTAQASSHEDKIEQDAEDTALCQNCFALLKLEDVADHADNCPKLLVCEKCHSRVVAEDYGKHLDGQCPANKHTCTNSQVDEAKEDKLSTKPTSYGAQNREHNFEERAAPCPYCETLWENKDLQEHIKNCQRAHFEALNSPSGKMDGHEPANSFFHESNADTRFIKETEEDHEQPKEIEDDIEALKKRVEELEHRIENLERPLRRLIERLRNTE